jgi:hypothetical protein
MSDERFVLPRPPEPEKTDQRPHPIRQRLDIVAIVIALFAAAFSALQWHADDRQARAAEQTLDIAEKSLDLAKRASEDQAADVERARAAAEASARSAALLAEAAKRSAAAAESTLSDVRVVNRLGLVPEINADLRLDPLKLANRTIPPQLDLVNRGPVDAVNIEIRLIALQQKARLSPGFVAVADSSNSWRIDRLGPGKSISIVVEHPIHKFFGWSGPPEGRVIVLHVVCTRDPDRRSQYGGAKFFFFDPETGSWIRENAKNENHKALKEAVKTKWSSLGMMLKGIHDELEPIGDIPR